MATEPLLPRRELTVDCSDGDTPLRSSPPPARLRLLLGARTTALLTVFLHGLFFALPDKPIFTRAFLFLQWSVLFVATASLARRWMVPPPLLSVACYYSATILAFGTTFLICHRLDATAFSYDPSILPHQGAPTFSRFYFFSVTLQTLVGFGAMTPASYTTRVLALLQMCIGIVYDVGIITQTLEKLRVPYEAAWPQRERRAVACLEERPSIPFEKRGPPRGTDQYRRPMSPLEQESGSSASSSSSWPPLRPGVQVQTAPHVPTRGSWAAFVRKGRVVRRFIRQWLFPVVLFWEGANVGVLYAMVRHGHIGRERSGSIIAVTSWENARNLFHVVVQEGKLFLSHKNLQWKLMGICITFQVIAVVALVVVTRRFVNRPGRIVLVTVSFMIQGYLSVILVFAGIFMAIHLADPQSFSVRRSSSETGLGSHLGDLPFWNSLASLTAFSVTTMTGTGYGNVVATNVISQFALCCEMLISVLFTVVILGLGSNVLSDMQKAHFEENGDTDTPDDDATGNLNLPSSQGDSRGM